MTQLNKGDIVTIIGISDWMAHTVRNEIYATGETTADGKDIFKESSAKRKKFTLRKPLEDYGDDKLVFRNVYPFKIAGEISRDTGTGFTSTKISGNACFNIYGIPEDIRFKIEHNNLNKSFTAYDRVFCTTEDSDEFDTPVYPESPASCQLIISRREAATHSHVS